MPTTEHTATDTAFSSVVRTARSRWALRIAHSPDRARVGGVVYVGTRELRVGREGGTAASLQLVDRRLSRAHAGFRINASAELIITDHRSKNGTFVGGVRVDRMALRAGSVVRLGDTLLVAFQERDIADAPEMGLIGVSQSIAALRAVIARVASSRLSSLICGLTGTGKEVVARALHTHSGRRGPFVAINCAAIPETLVESTLFGHVRGAFTGATAAAEGAFAKANHGTLFLDEIGEMSVTAQPKLLRALELGEITPVGASRSVSVDVRVVSATNCALEQSIESGFFREDLFARLAGVEFTTPALRDRPDDVLPLLGHFWGKAAKPWTADFAEALLLWPWPRNVRELKRLAERLDVLYPHVETWDSAQLPEQMPVDRNAVDRNVSTASPSSGGPPERAALISALESHGGNVKAAAQSLGRSRRQLYRWMDQLGIDRGTGR